MRYPSRVQDIINELYERNKSLSKGNDDERRALTKLIIEQTIFEFPNDGYGWKSAEPTRPPSKDSMARHVIVNGELRLISWDLFDGTTRAPNQQPESIDITGQNFIEVIGTNHLKSGQEEPKPISNNEPNEMNPLVELLIKIIANQQEQIERTAAMEQSFNRANTNLTAGLAELKSSFDKGIKIRF
jgi:hypothetical protein